MYGIPNLWFVGFGLCSFCPSFSQIRLGPMFQILQGDVWRSALLMLLVHIWYVEDCLSMYSYLVKYTVMT